MSTITTDSDLIRSGQEVHEDVDEIKVETASQWQLMWWKFRRHQLAMVAAVVIILFYLIALFADFVAPNTSGFYVAEYVHAPPQTIQQHRNPMY